jgi:cytoskeleton protein RodZ
MAAVSISNSKAGMRPEPTDNDHFGCWLRRAREQRALSIGDVSVVTKVPRSSLDSLERGDLGALPAPVFVRGFIRSYARAVGAIDTEPLSLYDRAIKAESEAKHAQAVVPVVDPTIAGIGTDDDEEMSSRRGLGLAVFVIILLLIATITLSLLLRRPPQSGEGLSQSDAPGAHTAHGTRPS